VLNHDGPPIDLEHVAIQLDATLPRVGPTLNLFIILHSFHVQIVASSDIFSSASELQEAKQTDDPTAEISQHDEIANQQRIEILEVNISKVVVTNARTETTSSSEKLEQHLALFRETTFFDQTQWPFSPESTNTRVSPMFEKHPYDAYLYNNPLKKKNDALPEPLSASSALHSYYTMTTDSLKKVSNYLPG
jgi:hypothetical protein